MIVLSIVPVPASGSINLARLALCPLLALLRGARRTISSANRAGAWASIARGENTDQNGRGRWVMAAAKCEELRLSSCKLRNRSHCAFGGGEFKAAQPCRAAGLIRRDAWEMRRTAGQGLRPSSRPCQWPCSSPGGRSVAHSNARLVGAPALDSARLMFLFRSHGSKKGPLSTLPHGGAAHASARPLQCLPANP